MVGSNDMRLTAGDFWREQRENGREVAVRNKKGTYQASCLKGIEEKKESSSERATGKAAFSGEEPSFCLNKLKEVELFRDEVQDKGICWYLPMSPTELSGRVRVWEDWYRDLDSIISHYHLSLYISCFAFLSLQQPCVAKPQCWLKPILCFFHACETILLSLHSVNHHNLK